MFVAVDGRPAGLVAVADPIKDSSPEAIETLHGEGIRIVMLTGDSATTAEAVARARRLSRLTMANIQQNLFFAFAYNAAGVPSAAGVLYPFFGLLLSPVIAAAMRFSSVSVVANALRLRKAGI